MDVNRIIPNQPRASKKKTHGFVAKPSLASRLFIAYLCNHHSPCNHNSTTTSRPPLFKQPSCFVAIIGLSEWIRETLWSFLWVADYVWKRAVTTSADKLKSSGRGIRSRKVGYFLLPCWCDFQSNLVKHFPTAVSRPQGCAPAAVVIFCFVSLQCVDDCPWPKNCLGAGGWLRCQTQRANSNPPIWRHVCRNIQKEFHS